MSRIHRQLVDYSATTAMNEGKMSRGNNWLYEHKSFLLELIEKNLDVLEKKRPVCQRKTHDQVINKVKG